jgi:hypothetical protein
MSWILNSLDDPKTVTRFQELLLVLIRHVAIDNRRTRIVRDVCSEMLFYGLDGAP